MVDVALQNNRYVFFSQLIPSLYVISSTGRCKCLFDISFLNTAEFPTQQIGEVVAHPVKACGNRVLT